MENDVMCIWIWIWSHMLRSKFMNNANVFDSSFYFSWFQGSIDGAIVVISQSAWWGKQCGCNQLWRKSTKRKFNQIYLHIFFNVERLNHYNPVLFDDRIPYLFIVSHFLFNFFSSSNFTFVDFINQMCTRQKKVKNITEKWRENWVWFL